MKLTGNLLIGGTSRHGRNGSFEAVEAATGEFLPTSFGGASIEDLREATKLSWEAFPIYRETSLEKRAEFLEKIAALIAAADDDLIARTMAETGLPKARLEGERMRTINQLKMFATEVRSGRFLDKHEDKGDPTRSPVAKPDLKFRNIAIGPVAVFGASNFPFAFSVAGGDTAAALAAGFPVVVKAHSAHPGTSEVIGFCVQQAVAECGLPAGTFALLHTIDNKIAQALVADPYIRAVGFTGSRSGGLALMEVASKRKQPIPVYAEMSSINPVILLPEALKNNAAKIATSFVSSLTMGAGQFCTNPGLILAVECEGLDVFLKTAVDAVGAQAPQTMLTPNIAKAYRQGVGNWAQNPRVKKLAEGQVSNDFQCQAALFETNASDFTNDHTMQDEIFGSASLVVRCKNISEFVNVLSSIEGQLTIAVHMQDSDEAVFKEILPLLEVTAGRILINGFGTGVEVSPAMVHGGPYPSTSDGRSTSVGTAAIYRFLRPVCYQDFSPDILPDLLK